MSYILNKDCDEIFVEGDNQEFTEEDKVKLWTEHKILYMGGVLAVWIEDRKDRNPLVHLMSVDDGCIFWSAKKDVCFDSYWINDYIDTLSNLKSKISI